MSHGGRRRATLGVHAVGAWRRHRLRRPKWRRMHLARCGAARPRHGAAVLLLLLLLLHMRARRVRVPGAAAVPAVAPSSVHPNLHPLALHTTAAAAAARCCH